MTKILILISRNIDYAIRESATSVKTFRSFKERSVLNVGYSADGLSGGVLLGVKGQGGIGLFDWYVSYCQP